jgi:type IV pilus assembly protein PilQ
MYDSKETRTKTQLTKSLLLCAVVFLAMVAITIGGVAPNDAEPVDAVEEAMPVVVAEVAAAEAEPVAIEINITDEADEVDDATLLEVTAESGDRKSFKFAKDCTLRKAVDLVASLYQQNVKSSPGVDGQLGLKALNKVTFTEALDAILDENFRYEQQENLTRVYTKAEYTAMMTDESRKTHAVFTLYYTSATEAMALLAPVLSAKAKISATVAAERILPTGESISAGTGAGDAAAMNEMLIIHDFPENLERAGEVLDAVDVRPLQVLVEATILSVTLNEDSEFGIDWTTIGNVVTQVAAPVAVAGDLVRGTNDFVRNVGTNQVTKTGGFSFGVSHDDVGVLIRAVEQVTDLTVLANPKILAINKQLGQVYIGQKLGYKSQTTQNDNTTTEKIDFLDTGTKLSFRPFIGNDGYIRMDIHPKDSSGSLNADGVPNENAAELVTNIMVKDGETVIIGGMFRDQVTAKRTQIPLLGNLPLIGAAFRGTADGIQRQEVIVMLTPHIIEEPSETQAHMREADVSRKHRSATKNFQSIGRPRIAEDLYAKATAAYVEGDKEAATKFLKKALVVRPTYLEALRLRDRIAAEAGPEEVEKLERVMLDNRDEEEAPEFRRR